MRRTLAEVAGVIGAAAPALGAAVVTGLAYDSREVAPGMLFVALTGERSDGHHFVAAARQRGAVAAVVRYQVDDPLPQLVVGDPLGALQLIARHERELGAYQLVAVTGSIAKTTTKELLAAFLGTTFPVGHTRGNRNSQIGFPAELCNQPEIIRWLVAELGMSHAGELDTLGAIARPDALLYTVIAPVHLEFFASVDAIAEAKAELIPHLDSGGLLVLNDADERVAAFDARFSGSIVRYGRPGASDFWLAHYEGLGLLGSRFRLCSFSGETAIELPLPGRHEAENVLAAAATAISLGVAPAAIAAEAPDLQPGPHRGVVHRLPSGAVLFDDSYNASPLATHRALELLAATSGRHIAVLGEMLELGSTAPELHAGVGRLAAGAADLVLSVGGSAAAELSATAGERGRHVSTWADALAVLGTELRDGDVVLVKGSRGIALDRLVDGLLGEASR